MASLRRCLAPDVFLRPLADKFARLALQLAARYAAWLQGGAGNDGAAGHQQQQGGEAGATQVAAPHGLPFSDEGLFINVLIIIVWQLHGWLAAGVTLTREWPSPFRAPPRDWWRRNHVIKSGCARSSAAVPTLHSPAMIGP